MFYITLFISLLIYAYTYSRYSKYVDEELKEMFESKSNDSVINVLLSRILVTSILIVMLLVPYFNVLSAILTYVTFRDYASKVNSK